jgi:hypothetical protein
MNCLLPIFTTCELALWRVVGNADPQPNMCISNGSISFSLFLIRTVAKIKTKAANKQSLPVHFVRIAQFAIAGTLLV